MNIKIIDSKIPNKDLQEMAKEFYGSMIKGVVDVEREILAMGGEYHMDANNILIENTCHIIHSFFLPFYPR